MRDAVFVAQAVSRDAPHLRQRFASVRIALRDGCYAVVSPARIEAMISERRGPLGMVAKRPFPVPVEQGLELTAERQHGSLACTRQRQAQQSQDARAYEVNHVGKLLIGLRRNLGKSIEQGGLKVRRRQC